MTNSRTNRKPPLKIPRQLTPEVITGIRVLNAERAFTIADFAEAYNVSSWLIRRILQETV